MADSNQNPLRFSEYPKNDAPKLPKEQTGLFEQAEIDESRWNKYFPYQLLVVTATTAKDGKSVSYARVPGFQFTLPIPPQELGLDMPIASSVQATLNGIAEIHGGAPFRNITLVGTTGVNPRRGAAKAGRDTDTPDAGRNAAAIFAGTVQSATRVAASAQTLIGGRAEFPNMYTDGKDSKDPVEAKSTGYYQYQLLERFIESYVALKSKNRTVAPYGDTRQLRLALAVWKDNAVYICTGVQLTKRKTASDPHLSTYTLQLKAWARVNLDSQLKATKDLAFYARNPNAIAEGFNRLRAARDLINGSADTLRAVVTDATSTVTETLRQTALFMKSVAGLNETLEDFPATIQQEALPLIVANWNNLRNQFEGLISPETDEEFRGAQTSGQMDAYSNSPDLAPGGSREQDLQVLLTNTSPSSLNFKQGAIKRIQAERDRVKAYTRLDFEKLRDSLSQTADAFAFAVGAGNATYAATFGLAAPSGNRVTSQAEFDVLMALNESLVILDHLAASGQINPPTPTSIEYVAGLAQRSGIAFKIPQSKFPIPFPYGYTLERLALRYLGDANRWHEIATLNGLRAPYVDEEGFALPLLTNGSGNQVVVADASSLYQGQTVWLSGLNEPRIKRVIQKLDPVAVGNVIVTLDGDSDLDTFTTSAGAVLEAFLPATVNSQQILYIPSDNPAAQDPETKAVPGVDQFDPLLQIGGIDLLLTQDGDLAITPDGDCRIAYGLANIVQTVRLAFAIPQGGLLQHPEYGLNIPVGASTADISAQDILSAATSLFAGDPTFTGVRNASVLKKGNTTYVTLEVGLAGTSTYLPITVEVNR